MNLIQQIEAEEIAKSGKDIPEFRAGDTVRVGVKVKEGNRERVQNYEGVVIARSNRGMGSNFTVRKMSFGEGVERVFPLYSPNVAEIQVVRRGRVRRALEQQKRHRYLIRQQRETFHAGAGFRQQGVQGTVDIAGELDLLGMDFNRLDLLTLQGVQAVVRHELG